MPNDKQLTANFDALAKPVSRQFIELIASQPRTDRELQMFFDLSIPQIQHTGNVLAALGLITRADPEHYDYHPDGLAPLREWIARIDSMRGPITGTRA